MAASSWWARAVAATGATGSARTACTTSRVVPMSPRASASSARLSGWSSIGPTAWGWYVGGERRVLGQGQFDVHARADARAAVDGDGSAVRVHRRLDDREAQAGATA